MKALVLYLFAKIAGMSFQTLFQVAALAAQNERTARTVPSLAHMYQNREYRSQIARFPALLMLM
jgi:hypothetical protein